MLPSCLGPGGSDDGDISLTFDQVEESLYLRGECSQGLFSFSRRDGLGLCALDLSSQLLKRS